MGSELALTVARHLNCNVVIRDVTDETLARSKDVASKVASRTVRRGEATEQDAAGWLSRLRYVTKLEDIASAQPELVIEAVFEDMALKQNLFAELGKLLPASTLLCSNTSALPITSIASRRSTRSGLSVLTSLTRPPS